MPSPDIFGSQGDRPPATIEVLYLFLANILSEISGRHNPNIVGMSISFCAIFFVLYLANILSEIFETP